MKRLKKIMFATAVCVSAVCLSAGLAACSKTQKSDEKIFEDYEHVFDDTVVREGFRLDGVLNEQEWEGKTEYVRTSSILNRELRYAAVNLEDCGFTMKTVFGEEGILIGAFTNDGIVNCTASSVFSKTSIVIYIGLGDGTQAEFTFAADNTRALRLYNSKLSSSYNLYPFKNICSTVLVEKGQGYTLECYIPWSTLSYPKKPSSVSMVGGLIRNTTEQADSAMTWEQFGSGNGYVTYRNVNTWSLFNDNGYVEPDEGETFGIAGDYMPSVGFDLTNDRGDDAFVLYNGEGTNHLYFKNFAETKFYAETQVQLMRGDGYKLGNDDPKVGFVIAGNRSVGSKQFVYAVAQLWENAKNNRVGTEVNRFRMAYKIENAANNWTSEEYSRNVLNVLGSDMTTGSMKLALYRDGTQIYFFADDILVGKTQNYEYIPADLATYVGISSWNVPCKFTDYAVVSGTDAELKFNALSANPVFCPAENGGKYYFDGFKSNEFYMETTVSARQGTDLSQTSRGDDLRAGLELWSDGDGTKGRLGVYVLFEADGTLKSFQVVPNSANGGDNYDWNKMMANISADALQELYPAVFTDEYFSKGSYIVGVYHSGSVWGVSLNGVIVAGTDITVDSRVEEINTLFGGADAEFYGGVNARSDASGAAFVFSEYSVTTDCNESSAAYERMREARKDLSEKGVFGAALSQSPDAIHRNYYRVNENGSVYAYSNTAGTFMLYSQSLGTQFFVQTKITADPAGNVSQVRRQGLYFETEEGIGLLFAVVADAQMSGYNKIQVLQYSGHGATLLGAVKQYTQTEVEKFGAQWGDDNGDHTLLLYRNGEKWYFGYNGAYILCIDPSVSAADAQIAKTLEIGESTVHGGIYTRNLETLFSDNEYKLGSQAVEAYAGHNVFGGSDGTDAKFRGCFAIAGSTVTASTTTRTGGTLAASQTAYLLYEDMFGSQFYYETTIETDTSQAQSGVCRNGLYITDGTNQLMFVLNASGRVYNRVQLLYGAKDSTSNTKAWEYTTIGESNKTDISTVGVTWSNAGPHKLAVYRNGADWYFFYNNILIWHMGMSAGVATSQTYEFSFGTSEVHAGIVMRNLPAVYTNNLYLTDAEADEKFTALTSEAQNGKDNGTNHQ